MCLTAASHVPDGGHILRIALLAVLLLARERHYRLLRLPRRLGALYVAVRFGHDRVALPLWLALRWLRRRAPG